MTRNYLIRVLQQYGIIQQDLSLNPVFRKRLLANPAIAQHLLEWTSFMRGDVCFKMRLHALIQGIDYQPTCVVCGRDVIMRLTGRYRFSFPTHCCQQCVGNDTNVIAMRISTNQRKYGANTNLTASLK